MLRVAVCTTSLSSGSVPPAARSPPAVPHPVSPCWRWTRARTHRGDRRSRCGPTRSRCGSGPRRAGWTCSPTPCRPPPCTRPTEPCCTVSTPCWTTRPCAARFRSAPASPSNARRSTTPGSGPSPPARTAWWTAAAPAAGSTGGPSRPPTGSSWTRPTRRRRWAGRTPCSWTGGPTISAAGTTTTATTTRSVPASCTRSPWGRTGSFWRRRVWRACPLRIPPSWRAGSARDWRAGGSPPRRSRRRCPSSAYGSRSCPAPG